MLTQTDVEKSLPPTLKSAATQALTDKINNIVADPLIAENIRENFISYTSVLRDGRFKTEDYLHAVTYVSHKMMGLTNQDAYFQTFPGRYQNLLNKNTPAKSIAAYVSAYHKGKLVNAVMEQTMTPHWILNQEVYQKAINVQADLMINADSEKVRTEAANSLLTHLAKPKDLAPSVQIDLTENSGMIELKDMLKQMAGRQQELITSGVTTGEIAAQPLIEGKVKEIDPS